MTDTLKIYVPVKSIDAYKSAEGWSAFTDRFVGYNFETGEVVESEPMPANNEIWYTSSDVNVVTPGSTNVFGATIKSNTYSDGRGIITFDGDVTKIGYNAFYNCHSLISVTIPDSVTTIEYEAFWGCTSLTSVYCKATTPPALGTYVFDYNGSGRKIYVPTESVDAYKSANCWSSYASAIVGYDF